MPKKTKIPESHRYGVDLIMCFKDILEKKISIDEINTVYVLNFNTIDFKQIVQYCDIAEKPGCGTYGHMTASTPVDRLRSLCREASPEINFIKLLSSGKARRELKAHTWHRVFEVLKKLYSKEKIIQPEDPGPYFIPENIHWIQDLRAYKLKPKAA